MKYALILTALAALSACNQTLPDCTDPDAIAAGYGKQHPSKDVCIEEGMKFYLPPLTKG